MNSSHEKPQPDGAGVEEGLEAVRKVAKKSPEAFVAIAARICPNDVRLTLEQAIPGGMSLEDY